jgi:hypothetical protein
MRMNSVVNGKEEGRRNNTKMEEIEKEGFRYEDAE